MQCCLKRTDLKNLLLTGATGFIGSYLLELLIETDYNIIILKRKTSDLFRIKDFMNKVVSYDVETTDIQSVFQEHEIEGVIHLATHYVKSHASDDIENMIDSNVKFPSLLVECANRFDTKFFINTGTFFEYSTLRNPLNEESQQLPFNLYASTKSSFDAILKYYAHHSKLNILTLKLAAPFGFNDNFKLIPFLIDGLLNDKEIILEKGEQEWDFIYVRDIVNAYMKAIDLCLTSPRSFYEEILIGSGKSISIKNIISILKNISNKDIIHLKKDYSTKQIFLSSIDNSKARNLLQWNPQYSIENALKETYDLYKENSK